MALGEKKKMYGRTFEGIIRMTYVIDEKGIIEQIFNKVKQKSILNRFSRQWNNNKNI